MQDMKPVALLITPITPLPTGSGRALRAWDWLQTLARNYRVHVLTPEIRDYNTEYFQGYPAERVWPITDAAPNTPRFLKIAGSLFPFLTPWFTRLFYDWINLPPDDPILDELKSCLAGESVGHILVFRLCMHNLALEVSARFPAADMSLDLDDHESRTRLSVARSLARMGRYRDAARTFALALQYYFLERLMPGPYRAAYLAVETDCSSLATRLADEVDYRPNRLSVPDDVPPAPATSEITLLFVGELSYPPNEEAVRFMLIRLQAELHKNVTRPWRLCVIGRRPSAKLAQLIRHTRHVEHIDDAEDLKDWYAAAHIALVPLFAGGGSKYKTLEGFAHRRPVVSTSHGVRGLGAIPGKHFLLAETARSFALAIDRLARDQALADRIADTGRELCLKHFRMDDAE